MTMTDMTTETQPPTRTTPLTPVALTPVEQALVALREAQDAHEAADLDLKQKTEDAFREEYYRVTELGILVNARKQQLVDAIGANGPLPAEAKSEVGWAHYSGATKRVYAEPSKWRATLHDAGMAQLVPAILTEAVNMVVVDRLCQTSGEFHRAVETLITEKAGKPVLRFGFSRDNK